MVKIFRNYEIKVITFFIIVAFLVFSVLGLFTVNKFLEDISNNYAKQNIALVGAILDSNQNLESEIIPIITKGDTEKFYKSGETILKKYYYTNSLSVMKNPLIKNRYKSFSVVLFIVWAILLIVVLFIVIKGITPLYKNLSLLGKFADGMVEGDFRNKMVYLNEGELSIFYNKFTDMGERLESALNQLKEERENLKNIISDISHQLKTPLAALIAYNDILKNQGSMTMEDTNTFIELSSDQLDRMEWLITTLLKYARLEGNVVQYNKTLKPLKDTVESAIEPLMVKALEKDQKIVIDTKGEGIYFHDKKWIAEALSNIIKNAIEHTGENGKINISLEETPLSITITIKDNGEGIEKSELRKIFKRFYKGQNSLNPTSIGIGLSLSKKIIESHSGSIVVDSEVGRGSKFLVTFLKSAI